MEEMMEEVEELERMERELVEEGKELRELRGRVWEDNKIRKGKGKRERDDRLKRRGDIEVREGIARAAKVAICLDVDLHDKLKAESEASCISRRAK